MSVRRGPFPSISSATACLLLLACLALWLALHAVRPRWVRVAAMEPSSALTVSFINYANPPQALGRFQPAPDPQDPARIFHWEQEATLEAGLLAVLEEARDRGLDGHGRVGPRRAALDLIFASNHSARVPVPGPGGERVGAIVVDRTRPSPARAGVLAVLQRLARSHRGRFAGVRVHTVFLLNCGSDEDREDHRIIQQAVQALCGEPPVHLLTTSGKVSPYYWYVAAGHATGLPLTLHDTRPGPRGLESTPFLRIGRNGYYNFSSGEGRALERPVVISPGAG